MMREFNASISDMITKAAGETTHFCSNMKASIETSQKQISLQVVESQRAVEDNIASVEVSADQASKCFTRGLEV